MWFSVGAGGVTADAPALVFSRVGVGKEREGEPVWLVPSSLSFLLCGAGGGVWVLLPSPWGWRSGLVGCIRICAPTPLVCACGVWRFLSV